MIHTALETGHTQRVGLSERMLVLIMLLLALGAFQNLLVTGKIDTQNMGMFGMQILWSLLYLVVLTIYCRVCRKPVRRIFALVPIVAVCALAFASSLWSQDWQLSMRRSVALAFSLMFGVYFASRFNLREQLRLLAVAFFVCIAFSFIFELFKLNPDEDVAGWYGVFYLKTQLGSNMALGTLVYSCWKKIEPEKAAVARMGFIGCLILVLLSRDVTSLITVVVILAATPYLIWAFHRRLLGAISAIISALLVGMLLILYVGGHLQQVTGLVGKDPMLTGRVQLWILSTAMALQRPWFGYGFDAFWIPGTTYVRRMWQILRWMPPHAHNGLLELWLELGLAGLGIFLIGFGYYFLCAVRYLRAEHAAVAAWPVGFLLFQVFSNLTESHFLVANNLYFVLYVAVATTLVACKSNRFPAHEPV